MLAFSISKDCLDQIGLVKKLCNVLGVKVCAFAQKYSKILVRVLKVLHLRLEIIIAIHRVRFKPYINFK